MLAVFPLVCSVSLHLKEDVQDSHPPPTQKSRRGFKVNKLERLNRHPNKLDRAPQRMFGVVTS
ncbi:mCG147172 [Mus musculus]|nr:mCG147172 [Mus musculus]